MIVSTVRVSLPLGDGYVLSDEPVEGHYRRWTIRDQDGVAVAAGYAISTAHVVKAATEEARRRGILPKEKA